MRTLFAFLLLVLGAVPLSAQGHTYRIRLTEPWSNRLGQTVYATLPDRTADSLNLADRDGGTVHVPRTYVIAIDSLLGTTPTKQRVRKGAVDGLIFGMVVGTLFGALTREGMDRPLAANAGLFAAIGGAGGAVIGAGTGAIRSGERWETVWPPLSLSPRR